MKIKVDIQNVQETLEAPDAAAMLRRVKEEASSRAPFLLRGVIRAMGDLTFAGEAVKRHNSSKGTSDPIPASAQEFLDWSVARGYVTILEA